MIRKQAKVYTAFQYLTDIFLTIVSLPLAYYVRLGLGRYLPERWDSFLAPLLHPLSSYLWLLLLIVPFWSLLFESLKVYRSLARISLREQAVLLLELELIAGVFLGFALFILKLNLSRSVIALFLVINFALLIAERMLINVLSKPYQEEGHYKSILIIGEENSAKEITGLIEKYKDWGLRVIGYVSTREKTSLKTFGTLEDVPRIIEENIIDEIIFASSDKKDLERFEEIFPVCEEQGVRVRLVANFFPQAISKIYMEYLDHVPLITFSTTPDHAIALLIKRIIDFALSVGLLILLSPLMLMATILIKLTSKGPIVYKQTRCGLYGRPFTLYKFRSMMTGAEDKLWEIKHLNEMEGPVFKMHNDPRVTKLGRVLRKTSVDELPQLYNVLKGDMSLVGPRAPLPEEVKEYTRWQRRRLSVKPGITCLWQISGRNEINFNEWMNLDLQYIDNWSLLLDIKILLKTIPVVLLGKGAR